MNPKTLLKLPAATLVLAALVVAGGCAGKSAGISDEPVPGEQTVVYEVLGMDCPGCHGGLENLVNAVPGVLGSKASWQAKTLTVRVEPGAELDDAAVAAAIQEANFTPGGRRK